MIDIHSHVLPAIDDGAASLEMSLAMLEAAKSLGFDTVVATPHLTTQLDPQYSADVQAAFRQVEAHARTRGMDLIPGFEIRLTPDLPARLRAGEAATLGGSRVVLVDLPFIDWPHFVDATLFDVQTSGFQVILAHPERYPRIQQDPSVGLALAERGIALQVTIGSFGGVFGKRAKRAAEALLALGAVHLVATDAHSAGHRMAAVPAGLQRLEQLVGQENLRQLTVAAPSMLLNGGELPQPINQPPKRGLRKVFAGIGLTFGTSRS